MTEPNDHLTIEQRLGMIEAAVRLLNIHVDEINDWRTGDTNAAAGLDEDILDLAERVSKLEDANEPDNRKIYIGFKQKDKENGCD